MPQRTVILTAACSAVQCWYKGRTPRDLARVEAHRGAGSRHPGIVTPPCVLKSPLNHAIYQSRSTTITRASIISHFIFTTADYTSFLRSMTYLQDLQMPKAAIFDVDGTLVDSVDLHASAWQEALVKFGHQVTFEQARSQIGKGGDQLIPVFLSKAEQADHGEAMEEWRGKLFKSKYLFMVQPFSAVPELLRRVRDAGVTVAVASSAKKAELDKYLDIACAFHKNGTAVSLIDGQRFR